MKNIMRYSKPILHRSCILRNILTSLLILAIYPNLSAQKFDLFNSISGESKEMIQVDEYIYISGIFSTSINFGTTTLTTPAANIYNIYLAKYDTLGNFIWAQKGGNTTAPIPQYSNMISGDLPTDIAADTEGNIYLTGIYEGDSCHWGNLSISNIVPFGTYTKPGFITKIDPSGKVVWLNKLAAQDSARGFRPESIKMDFGVNNLFISGRYRLPMVYGATNNVINAPPGFSDRDGIWVAKLDTAGNIVESGVVITLDSNSRFTGSTFNSEIEVTNDSTFFLSLIVSPYNSTDIFSFGNTQTLSAQSLLPVKDVFAIAKFSSFTNCNWIVHSSSRYRHNYARVKIIDDKHGGIYFTGVYNNDSLVVQSMKVKEDPNYTGSEYPLFYGKIDASGNLQELNSFENVRGVVAGLSMNNKDEIIISGSFADSIRVGGKSLINNGLYDIFVINTDTAFTPNWYQVGGGSRNEIIVSTSSDNTSSIFFFLWYSGLAQFGSRYLPGNSSYTTSLIGKLSECTNAPPQVTFNGDTSLCIGDSVNLYTQVEPFSLLQWRKNNANLFGENFRDLTVRDSGFFEVITNQSGCIDTSAALYVGVNPFFPSNLILPDTLCENEIISLSGGTPIGGVYFGIGVSDSIFDPAIAGVGTTTISYTYNNVGCSDTISQSIVILPVPKPQISGASQVCAFDTSSNYSTLLNSSYNYLWSVTGGTIASGQGSNNILINWGPSGQGIISLSVMNTLGCDSIISDTVDIVSMNISASILGADSVCANSVPYSYSVSTPSLFYNWIVSGGSIVSGFGSSTIKVRWNNVNQGYLSVQLFNSCGSNSTFHDTVAIFTKPTLSILGDSSLCVNSSGISYTTFSPVIDYKWATSSNGTIVSGQNTSSIIVDWNASSANEIIKLIATNANGCSDSIVKPISFLASDSTLIHVDICQGQSYLFNGRLLSTNGVYKDTLVASNGCDSILSLFLNVLPNSNSSISASVCYGEVYTFGSKTLTSSGTYIDTVQSVNGCDSIISLNLSFQAPIDDTVINVRDSLIAGQIGATYQWMECNANNTYSTIVGATNQYFVPNDLDYYAVAISLNNCLDTSLCYQGSISVGITNNFTKESDLKIYPNPTNNFITLRGTVKSISTVNFEIRSINGQLIHSKTISLQTNQLNERVNLSEYGKGVYFIRLIGLEQPFIKKVVVQ